MKSGIWCKYWCSVCTKLLGILLDLYCRHQLTLAMSFMSDALKNQSSLISSSLTISWNSTNNPLVSNCILTFVRYARQITYKIKDGRQQITKRQRKIKTVKTLHQETSTSTVKLIDDRTTIHCNEYKLFCYTSDRNGDGIRTHSQSRN